MGGGPRNLMAYEKALKWQIVNGSLIRRFIIRGFMFGIVIAALPLIQFACNFDPMRLYYAGFDECGSGSVDLYPNTLVGRMLRPVTGFPLLGYARCSENVNLTVDVVRDLLDRHLLNYGTRALCVGPDSSSAVMALRELGFASVEWAHRRSLFGRKEKEGGGYQLDYKDGEFDFLFARDLDKVSIPALVVSEMERVLRPGGIGAVILYDGGNNAAPVGLVRSAMPVSTYLKGSSVVHVGLSPRNTLVAFKKNIDLVELLVEHPLPADCASLRRNKPYVGQMEPLVEVKTVDHKGTGVAYLPDFLGITSSYGAQLVYVDMGTREVANFSNSNWFLPSYPIDSTAFNVYIVDHNALVLSSHVQKPGVNFIYHPGLSEDTDASSDSDTGEDTEEIPVDDDDFNFLAWFKDTVLYSDLVVLKMNSGRTQLKFLSELFESGTICYVDELFLECSDSDLTDENREGKIVGTCMDLFKKLRRTGVFVHQWWSN